MNCNICGALLPWGKQGSHICPECKDEYKKSKITFFSKYCFERELIKAREYTKQWRFKNPEKYKAASIRGIHTRRARIKGAGGSFTHKELSELYIKQENSCYYCGKPFFNNNTLEKDCHIDHKIPISRGGNNEISNIALSCASCNHHKSNKTEDEYLSEKSGV